MQTTSINYLPLKVIGTTIVILALLNLVGSNILATKGSELTKINQQIYQAQRQNDYLSQKIASHTSLSKIQAKAQELGFVSVSQPVALTTPAPVAYIGSNSD